MRTIINVHITISQAKAGQYQPRLKKSYHIIMIFLRKLADVGLYDFAENIGDSESY